MAKSPGHQQHPEHKVVEHPAGRRIQVLANGETVAESDDAIKVVEDHHPVRYYFPRSDVRMEKLTRTETTTQCPYKGTAHYFSIQAGGKKLRDAVWTYEDPYEEHLGLKGRVAFYDDKVPELEIRTGA